MAGINPVGGGISAATLVQAVSKEAPEAPQIKAPSESHEAAAALSLIQTAVGGASNGGGINLQA